MSKRARAILFVGASLAVAFLLSTVVLLRREWTAVPLPEVARPRVATTPETPTPGPPVPKTALAQPSAPQEATTLAMSEIVEEHVEGGVPVGLEGGLPGGVMGGVAGGVVGGLPGGVVGGVAGGVTGRVGGLPDASLRSFPLPARDEIQALRRQREPFETEAYDRIHDNPFLAARTNPLSTFSVDVDTASYANVRRFLSDGRLPPKDAVRIEELLNYFRYDYPQPTGSEPFSITTETAICPWQTDHRLVLVGLQGREVAPAQVPPRNLVFLVDVSGSMNEPRKLPLLKASLGLLVDQLRPEDRLAIVVYAGAAGLVLPPTDGSHKREIHAALGHLEAGGSTAGGAGIQLAYEVASEGFLQEGVNRVILATDGDFNVGVTSQGDLLRLIEEKRKTGVFLSVLGFGQGNLKDSTMEKLADHGNGNYSYVDSLREGRKVLVKEAGATLVTIAKDVKIQVEFNPARVSAYRLIGYENRVLRAEDFADDGKDAGEIGAGHSVTALYEVVPAGVKIDLPSVDPLKYQAGAPEASAATVAGELLTVKLRYKKPTAEESRPLSVAVREGAGSAPSERLRFAAAVAAFGMRLRESEHAGAFTWEDIAALAREARGQDRDGYRTEFLELVGQGETLARRNQRAAATRPNR